eukprot:SAG11_NODE_157_length_14147_cov_8.545202_5_plen_333_part_00
MDTLKLGALPQLRNLSGIDFELSAARRYEVALSAYHYIRAHLQSRGCTLLPPRTLPVLGPLTPRLTSARINCDGESLLSEGCPWALTVALIGIFGVLIARLVSIGWHYLLRAGRQRCLRLQAGVRTERCAACQRSWNVAGLTYETVTAIMRKHTSAGAARTLHRLLGSRGIAIDRAERTDPVGSGERVVTCAALLAAIDASASLEQLKRAISASQEGEEEQWAGESAQRALEVLAFGSAARNENRNQTESVRDCDIGAAASLQTLLLQARRVAYYESLTPLRPWTWFGVAQREQKHCSGCGVLTALAVLLLAWMQLALGPAASPHELATKSA